MKPAITKSNFYDPDINEFDRELRFLLKFRFGFVKSMALEKKEVSKELIDFEDNQILHCINEIKELIKKYETD